MNKWQIKAIEHLVNKKGYDEYTASKIYSRAYKRLSSKNLSEGFNRSFEAYASIAFKDNFVKFDIKNERLYYRDTGEDISSMDFEKAHTAERLKKLAEKNADVYFDLENYLAGNISLEELNKRIKIHKIQSQEYHKEGS